MWLQTTVATSGKFCYMGLEEALTGTGHKGIFFLQRLSTCCGRNSVAVLNHDFCIPLLFTLQNMIHHLQTLPGCFPQHYSLREVHAKSPLNDPLHRHRFTSHKVLRLGGSCSTGSQKFSRDVETGRELRKSMPLPSAPFCGFVQTTILSTASLALFLHLPVQFVCLSLYKGNQLAMG